MSEFDPKKLKVSLKNKISIMESMELRKYTLTHSDETGELFLTIGKEYDGEGIDYKARDEVLGTWCCEENKYYLLLAVQVDNGEGVLNTNIRDKIFREELPLAIKAIIFGDNLFIENNKELYDAMIIIKFNSDINEYNCIEEWGCVKDYKYDKTRSDGENQNINSQYNQKVFPLPGPVIPIPPIPITNPYPYDKNKGKNKIIEDALITILDRYIRIEVFTLFGKDTPYCLKKSEIIEAKVTNNYGPCTEQYEITIGLRVGKNQPFYNNMIITFVIDENNIKVKNIKNPR